MERGVSKGPVAPARSGANATPGRVGPWRRRPPGIPVPRAHPRRPQPLRPAAAPSGTCHPPAAPRRGAGPAPRPRILASTTPGLRARGPPASRGTGRRAGGAAGGCPRGAQPAAGCVGDVSGGRRWPVEPHGQSPAAHAWVGRAHGCCGAMGVCVGGGPSKVGWMDASGNGREVTVELRKAADAPSRGRVSHRENLPPPSSSKQKTQSKSEGSS